MAFLGKSKSILGLDIGVSSVKIVELIPHGKGFSLVNLGTAPIQIPADTKEQDAKKKAIVKAIKDIINTKKIKTKRVISGLLGQSVFIRMVNLPKSVLQKMRKEQIIGMLKTEIEAEIPFPLEEASIDFFYHGEIDEERIRKYKITVVVVPQEIAKEHIEIIQEAELRPVIIDTATFALCRAYKRLIKEEDLVKTVALIEISATTTEVNIIQEGNLQLTRTINLGGNTLTNKIKEALNISLEEAEKKKKEEDVTQIIQEQLEKIAEEIRNSFKYYQFQIHQQVEKVVLCGGGSKLKNIAEFLKEKLALPIEYLNPLEGIKSDPNLFPNQMLEDLAPSLGVCIGLGLRGVKEEKAVNFLPPELWERPFIVRRPILSEIIVLSIVIGTIFMIFTLRLKNYTKRLNDTRSALESMNPQNILEKLKELKEKKSKWEEDISIINKLAGEKTAYSHILTSLVDGLPPSMWLNRVSVGTEEIVTVEAPPKDDKKKSKVQPKLTTLYELKITINGSSLNTQGVASFMLYLKSSVDFKDVNLISLQQINIEEVPVMSFIIETGVKQK